MAKLIAVIVACLILISGLIAYDFSKFNSSPVMEDIQTESIYEHTFDNYKHTLDNYEHTLNNYEDTLQEKNERA